MEHKEEVEWYKVVWNNFNTPRHALNAWLVLQNKLMTKDRMNKMGISMDTKCVLCEVTEELRDHIFSRCVYIQQVDRRVFNFLGVRFMPSQWHLLIPWLYALKQNNLQIKLLATALTMLWYEVWKARNHSIFSEGENSRGGS
ncbi:hypothetical protein QQ045_019555 [Rhodiola kirilowii]